MLGERSVDRKLAPQDFVGDFVWAARAVLDRPGVLLVSVALWVVTALLDMLGAAHQPLRMTVSLGIVVFSLGWFGAERVFFLYRREGRNVSLRELVGAVPFFIGRFARLSVPIGLLFMPVMAVSVHLQQRYASAAARSAVVHASVLGFMIVVDLALTFVPSALVYTTRSAGQAFRIGVAMIRQTWPRSGLYLLCPPLALNMLHAIYPTHIPVVRLVITAALALLALAAKGATAAFYMRERAVSFDVATRLA